MIDIKHAVPPEEGWLDRLKQDAAKPVSAYFGVHDYQTVTVNREDLNALLADHRRLRREDKKVRKIVRRAFYP